MTQYRAQHRNRLRLIVFDANQHFARFKDPRQNADTFNNLCRALLHQAVIRRDIGFTLRRINNQGFDFIAAAPKLHASRKTRAAEPGDAELVNALNQLFTRALRVIVPAVARNPPIVAIRLDNHAQFRKG